MSAPPKVYPRHMEKGLTVSFPPPGDSTTEKTFGLLAALLLVANVFSALVFIGVVNRPAFDDPNNFPDVARYAREGVSISTIRRHINPTGPTSFIWMAMGVRVLPDNELRGARLAVVLSWILLGIGILAHSRDSRSPHLWHAGLAATLVFPHTLTATATVLTEGPAMLFAALGAELWLGAVASPLANQTTWVTEMAGGILMGLSITCRQYYLALLPAAGIIALYQTRNNSPRKRLRTTLSLLAAVIPVVVLILIWKGLSSPGMASGASYGLWKSKVGVNLTRPIVAAFYVALYLIPFSLTAVSLRWTTCRHRDLLYAAIVACAAGPFHSSLLQPGPLKSLIGIGHRVPAAESVLFGFVTGIAAYNFFVFTRVAWEKRSAFASLPEVPFALLVILFFVAEQLGVGGNIPFYELYVLQVAPFLGIVAFGVLPGLRWQRLTAMGLMFLASNALLWRYAFGG